MATIIPDNNLPQASQAWARELQKKVEELERNAKLEQFNSNTVDSQLQLSYRRIDNAIRDIGIVNLDLTQISAIASDAAFASTESLTGLTSLAFPESNYKVNGSNILGGAIDGGSA